ncbi:MAG: hypothetical protein Q9226_004867 [Calogaya cf. arnoldii]
MASSLHPSRVCKSTHSFTTTSIISTQDAAPPLTSSASQSFSGSTKAFQEAKLAPTVTFKRNLFLIQFPSFSISNSLAYPRPEDYSYFIQSTHSRKRLFARTLHTIPSNIIKEKTLALMASLMMNVWGQLSARATDTQNIKKVIKTTIEEKIILGHNITESATYVRTEHVIHSTPASIPAVSNTTFLTQSSWTVLEAAGSTSCLGWSVFTVLLCMVCLSALVGLCVGFWRYRHLLSLARLSLRLQDHIHHARRFLHIPTARIHRIFTSLPYTFTFIGVGIVVYVGTRIFNWAQHNNNGIFTTLVKSTWFVLTVLFYLLRQGANVVQEWIITVGQIMFAALLALKTHWLLTLVVTSATVTATKWKSMDWESRQDVWFKFLGWYRYLGDLVRTKNKDEPSSLWESSGFAASEAFDFGAEFAPDPVTPKRNFFKKSWDWCCTQDIGGMMMTLAMLEIKVILYFLEGLVKVILLLPHGIYRVHCRYRESSKQKIIDRMVVEQQVKDAVKDGVIAQKDALIKEQETQITTSDNKIDQLTGERDKFKGLKEQAERGKIITERQCAVSVANTQRDAQWKVSSSYNRYGSSSRAFGNFSNTTHYTYSNKTTYQISNIEAAPCKEHTAKITELQADNTALRNQLKAKVENTEAKPKVPELSMPKLSLENIPQDVLEEIRQRLLASGWQQILDEHAQFKSENTRITDENTRVAGEHAVLTHDHNLLTNEHTRISKEHSQFAAERPLAEEKYQQVIDIAKGLEDQVRQLQSGSSAQQGKSAEHMDLKKTYAGLQKIYADLQKTYADLKEEFTHVDGVSEERKDSIARLEAQKKQLETQQENNRAALSKALQEKHELGQQLETLRNSSQANAQPSPTNQPPAASQTNSNSAAEVAFTAAFPNGTSKFHTSTGANDGYLCLAKSLKFQHNIAVNWNDFQAIADYSLNAAHIAAARRDPPDNGLVHDPHQLVKILDLWSRQNRGHAARLGVRSKVISVPGFSYEILGDDEGQLVVWMAKSTSLKTGKTSWGAFGPPVSDGASGSAANTPS